MYYKLHADEHLRKVFHPEFVPASPTAKRCLETIYISLPSWELFFKTRLCVLHFKCSSCKFSRCFSPTYETTTYFIHPFTET